MSTHSELAKELFLKGYNCSQSVFAAFCDETGLDTDTALKVASSFGGGMGGLQGVCGAVSGMFMVVGMKYGYTHPPDKTAKKEFYGLIKHLAKQFEKEEGSIICRELLDFLIKNNYPGSGGKRHFCAGLVEQAARLLDEYILEKNKRSDS